MLFRSVDLHLDRIIAVLDTVGVICALGYLPHSCNHAASIYFYDADHRLLEHGKRKALMVLPNYHLMVGLKF